MSRQKSRRTDSKQSRSTSRSRGRRSQSRGFGPFFFVALVATVMSTIGFIGVVASVMAGS